jgi:VWFA-related protein
MERTPPTAAALAFALLATAGPASAQEPAETFGERIDVELVDFQVVVTDAEERPVEGLTVEDFEVFEDGRPVALSHFVAVGPSPAASPAEGEAPPAPPDLALAVFLGELPGPMREPTLAALREQLPGLLRPGARAMIVSYGERLRVEQALTADADLLLAAIERGAPTVRATALAAERRGLAQELAQYNDPLAVTVAQEGGGGPEGATTNFQPGETYLKRIHTFAERAAVRVDGTLAALQSLVDSMAGLPGRKAVLVVTAGLETRPGEDLFALWDDKFGRGTATEAPRQSGLLEARRYDRGDELRALAAAANAADIALYGLGPRETGLRLGSAEIGVRPVSGAATATVDPIEALAILSAATGGRAVAGDQLGGRLFARLAEDVTSYYALGFTRDPAAAGEREHRLEVKLRRPGLTALHRANHRQRTAAEQSADRTLAALIHDLTDNPIGIRVELGEPEKDGRDLFRVPVLIRIPLGKVLLVPEEAAHRAALAVVVAVQDADGGLSEPRRAAVPVRIENEKLVHALVQDLGYQLQLQVRGGEQKLAVAVVDELAAVTSTVNLSLAVGGG